MSSLYFEVCLKGGAPWGFRLTGGKEFRTSLRVSKVESYGKANNAGIEVNDEIVEINGKSVQDCYHTEALAFVKKAGNELHLALHRVVSDEKYGSAPLKSPEKERLNSKDPKMIEITAYGPSSTVPLKPMSATSVAHAGDPAAGYGYNDRNFSEWSPDLISDVTRIPEQIKLERATEKQKSQPTELIDDEQDAEERRKQVPQAPLSPQGFEKVKPQGRGGRRLTSSSSHSIEIYDETSIAEVDVGNHSNEEVSPFSYYPTNNALRHLQYNKAQADDDYRKRTSSLPRSLGKRQTKSTEQHRSSTLPRKKSEDKGKQSGVPDWYKDMYREINKSMEGQSNLSRLLTADAKKGVFRRYDGSTSPRPTSPKEGRRQRPKSIHVDRFTYDDGLEDSQVKKGHVGEIGDDGMEKTEKRRSVHSAWYREFQKGGEIPSTGLAADGSHDKKQQGHYRSKSSDDILSSYSKGLPYQTSNERSSNDRLSNPAKFEYNNPPDFLELRKKAEAEGALREDREREMRMLQEERLKWLEEEEKLQMSQKAAKRKAEELKEAQLKEAKRLEELQKRQQMELEHQRAIEMERMKESSQQRTIETVTDNKTKAIALFSFNAQSPMEISFKKGQSLDVLRQIDENWYEGEIDDIVGIFPVSYVKLCEDKKTGEQEEVPVSSKLEIEEGSARAKYSFQAENEKELSFKKNDVITLLRHLDDNWYEGEISDRIGIFPKAYVEVLKEPRIIDNDQQQQHEERDNGTFERPLEKENQHTDRGVRDSSYKDITSFPNVERTDVVSDKRVEKSLAKNNGERFRSLYYYRPMNEDEVELLENDTIYVLEKCDDGWFVGVCERTGKFGTFPGNYVVPF